MNCDPIATPCEGDRSKSCLNRLQLPWRYGSHTTAKERTEGDELKICTANRTPRETLEERLDKTPSNASCFAQGSSLMNWPIGGSLMGTAHVADELGLCSHGLAC
jgi:hypothetical protein